LTKKVEKHGILIASGIALGSVGFTLYLLYDNKKQQSRLNKENEYSQAMEKRHQDCYNQLNNVSELLQKNEEKLQNEQKHIADLKQKNNNIGRQLSDLRESHADQQVQFNVLKREFNDLKNTNDQVKKQLASSEEATISLQESNEKLTRQNKLYQDQEFIYKALIKKYEEKAQ